MKLLFFLFHNRSVISGKLINQLFLLLDEIFFHFCCLYFNYITYDIGVNDKGEHYLVSCAD